MGGPYIFASILIFDYLFAFCIVVGVRVLSNKQNKTRKKKKMALMMVELVVRCCSSPSSPSSSWKAGAATV